VTVNCVTLTLELELDMVKTNQLAICLDQWLFSSQVIARTLDTDTHIGPNVRAGPL